jgi:hypothetical protein
LLRTVVQELAADDEALTDDRLPDRASCALPRLVELSQTDVMGEGDAFGGQGGVGGVECEVELGAREEAVVVGGSGPGGVSGNVCDQGSGQLSGG